jgi:hypothetical protein
MACWHPESPIRDAGAAAFRLRSPLGSSGSMASQRPSDTSDRDVTVAHHANLLAQLVAWIIATGYRECCHSTAVDGIL